MNQANLESLIVSWLDGSLTEDQATELNALLRDSERAREIFRRESEMHGLLYVAVTASIVESSSEYLAPLTSQSPQRSRWVTWRPLTAAAAGIVFGMFCTSVVFGFVVQRAGLKQTPLVVYDAGLENGKQVLNDGLPEVVGQWGMDAAGVVSTEGDVKPLQGQHMMRLEPIPHDKNVKNHTSRVYQVLDLRSLPIPHSSEAEVQVSASFCSSKSDVSSRYLIRALALDEAPEQAMKNFWSKSESDGVVSESQRFDTKPGDRGWQTFSLKLRLPPESKTLVFILGAVPPEDESIQVSFHYVDQVQVTLLTPESTLP